MALAVGLGAIGTHLLQEKITPRQLEIFHTAVQYQMIHSIGLILVGLLIAHRPSWTLDIAAILMIVGIFFFSGFLYAYVATQYKVFAMIVPLGGVSFIAAWLAIAAAALGIK